MQFLCERDEHLLFFIRHRTAEHNEQLCLRHRLYLIQRRVGGELYRKLQPDPREQPLQLLHR